MTRTPAQPLQPALLLGAAVGLMLLYLTALVVFGDQIGALGKPFALVLTAIVTIACAILARLHWRRLDEPARAAHKVAWLKGSNAGLVVGCLAVVALMFAPQVSDGIDRYIAANRGHIHPTAFTLLLGFMACLLVQMVGYVIAWLRWWSVHRSQDRIS